MATYPGGIPSLTRPAAGNPANDGSATDATVVVDAMSDEIEAIATELGVNPSGGSATVVARLDALDSTVSGKAASSHTHSTSDITSLAEFVRDTIGSTLVAGSNVTVTVDDAGDTITVASTGGGGGLDAEAVRDAVAAFVTAGTNISVTHNDPGDTLTIAVTGLGDAAAKNTGTAAGTVAAGDHNHSGVYAAASHSHTAADVSDFAEVARDTLGTALTAGTGVTITPNDGADTITVATSALLPTLVDAKGDLLVGTAADTVARLAVGATNGHVLTVDSAEAAGMKWAAASGSSGYATVEDETTPLTQRTTLTFLGPGVEAKDGTTRTQVVVPGPYNYASDTGDNNGAAIEPIYASGADLTITAGHMYAWEVFFIQSSFAVDRIGFEVISGVSGGTADVGLYSALGPGLPSARLVQVTGTSTSASGFKDCVFSSPYTITTTTGTRYFIALLALTQNVTVRGAIPISGIQASGSMYYGDFTQTAVFRRTGLSSLPASTAYSGGAKVWSGPRIAMRRSS